MKKKWFNDSHKKESCVKIIRVMKLTVFVLFMCIISVSAKSFSQNGKYSLQLYNANMEEALSKLQSFSDRVFFYSQDDINKQMVVNVDLSDATLEDLLDACLKGTNLNYKVKFDNIVLYKKNIIEEVKNTVQKKYVITGTISDSKGEPLPFVAISLKGTTIGTTSNLEGRYSLGLDTKDNVVLEFSSLGFVTQKITANNRNVINIKMTNESVGLDEIIAIGYGVQKKSDLTTAIASIKGDELSKIKTTNPVEALQGRVAGVSVKRISGEPGGGVDIKIRGVGTVGNNTPLYIIDGLPGSMFLINPDDIESMEILKDGAAAAIYGSRAANGVIIITTKGGRKNGKLKVDINSSFGLTRAAGFQDLTNTEEYLQVSTQVAVNAGQTLPLFISSYLNGEIPKNDTDWQDAMFKDALMQNHSIALSGGSDKITYLLSASTIDEEGIMRGSAFEKQTVRAKMNIEEGIFKLSGNLSYAESKKDYKTYNIKEMYQMNPMVPIYDENAPSGYGLALVGLNMPSNANVMALHDNVNNYSTTHYFSGNINASLEPLKGLVFRLVAGINNKDEFGYYHSTRFTADPKTNLNDYPSVSNSDSNWRQEMIETIINYSTTIDKHALKLMLAYTRNTETNRWMDASITGKQGDKRAGFLDDNFDTLNGGQGGTPSVSGSNYTYTRASQLGRLHYSYDDKYIIQATVRRDGSSKFGEKSRYGVFPSFSAAWRVKQEGFLKDIEWIYDFKIRGSWGKLGNEITLGNYGYQALISTYDPSWNWEQTNNWFYIRGVGENESHWGAAIAKSLKNDDLHWEASETMNFGFDLAMFKGSLTTNFNYYSKLTSDMLVSKPVSPSGGVWDPIINAGRVKNQGIELELGYKSKIGKLNYSINTTLTTIKNEVLALGSAEETIYGGYVNGLPTTRTMVGKSIGSFYLYQTDGIFQSNEEVNTHVSNVDGQDVILQTNARAGDIRFVDVNKDGILDSKDQINSGSGIPSFEYSINMNLDYKDFDFSMLWTGVGDNKIYNGNRVNFEGMSEFRNYGVSAINAWTINNTDTNMPRAVYGDPNENNRASTRFLEDGDYLRLRNIQLGYTLPKGISSAVAIDRCRFYISGQNLLTFTNYSGLDPEVGSSSVWSPGLDLNSYPMTKSFLMGVQITF